MFYQKQISVLAFTALFSGVVVRGFFFIVCGAYIDKELALFFFVFFGK